MIIGNRFRCPWYAFGGVEKHDGEKGVLIFAKISSILCRHQPRGRLGPRKQEIITNLIPWPCKHLDMHI